MTDFTAQRAADVAAETGYLSDQDPGRGDILFNTTGLPTDNNQGQPQPAPPTTFDQAHPEYSYTRPAPEGTTVPVRTKPARSFRTRSITLPVGGDPYLLLARNPKRLYADIWASTADMYAISDDAAQLVSASATVPGGAVVPVAPYAFRSTGELFASALAATPGFLSVIEYIDE